MVTVYNSPRAVSRPSDKAAAARDWRMAIHLGEAVAADAARGGAITVRRRRSSLPLLVPGSASKPRSAPWGAHSGLQAPSSSGVSPSPPLVLAG